jgi:hypothetical protein
MKRRAVIVIGVGSRRNVLLEEADVAWSDARVARVCRKHRRVVRVVDEWDNLLECPEGPHRVSGDGWWLRDSKGRIVGDSHGLFGMGAKVEALDEAASAEAALRSGRGRRRRRLVRL